MDGQLDNAMTQEFLRLFYQQNMLMQQQSNLLFSVQGNAGAQSSMFNVGGYPGPFGFQIGQSPSWMGNMGTMASIGFMAASPFIGGAFSDAGYAAGPIFGRYNWYDQLRNQQQFDSMVTTIRNNQAGDVNNVTNMLTRVMSASRGDMMTAGEYDALQDRMRVTANRGIGLLSTIAAPFMATPGGLQQLETLPLGLHNLLGHQMAAAHIYLANRTAPTAGGRFGLGPSDLQAYSAGFTDFFTNGDTMDVMRSRGFSLGQLGSIYEQGRRIGVIGAPGTETASADYTRVSGIAKSLETVADLLGPGASVDTMLRSLERIAGASIANVSDARIQSLMLNLKEAARLTGVPLDGGGPSIVNIAAQLHGTAGTAIGLPAIFSTEAAMTALVADMATRNAGIRSRASLNNPTQAEVVELVGQNTLSGIGSQMFTVAANLRRFQKDNGMALPGVINSALNDLTSGDPARAARAWSALDPALVAGQLSAAYGGNQQLFMNSLMDRNLAADYMQEFIPHAMTMQLGGLAAREAGALSWLARSLGMPGSAGSDLLFGYQGGGGGRAAGMDNIKNLISNQLFGGDYNSLSADQKITIDTKAIGAESFMRGLIRTGFVGRDPYKAFFSIPDPKAAANIRNQIQASATMNAIYSDSFPEGKLPFAGRLFQMLGNLNGTNASFTDIMGELFGQAPVGSAFTNASLDNVQKMAMEYGVSLTDPAGVKKDARMLGFELGQKWIEMLDDPGKAESAKQLLGTWFQGASGGKFLGMVSANLFRRQLSGVSEANQGPLLESQKRKTAILKSLGLNVGGGFADGQLQLSAKDKLSSMLMPYAVWEATFPSDKGSIENSHINGAIQILQGISTSLFDAAGEVRSDIVAAGKLTTEDINALKGKRQGITDLIRKLGGKEGDVMKNLLSARDLMRDITDSSGMHKLFGGSMMFDGVKDLRELIDKFKTEAGKGGVQPMDGSVSVNTFGADSGEDENKRGSTAVNPMYVHLTNGKEMVPQLLGLLTAIQNGAVT